MDLLEKIFGSSKKENDVPKAGEPTNEKEKKLIADFVGQTRDNRIRRLMAINNADDSQSFVLMRYAILNDADQNVKFAALKRIHLFKNYPDLLPLFNWLKENTKLDKLEPYFSMGMLNCGLITEKEFSERINNAR